MKFESEAGDSVSNIYALSATVLKNATWRFSSQNRKLLEFFGPVPKSTTHTSLICVKTLQPNISSLGPLKKTGNAGRTF
jgi:hypothetical protein